MPGALAVLLLALALLALFAVAGWGLLALLVPSLDDDVMAALAPVTGLAAFCAVAAFVAVRLPVWLALPLAAGVPLLIGLAGATYARRRVRLRVWLALAAVALVAVTVASVPSFVHGGGTPATWGNADPYYWVSQAKSMVSGPPPAPATRYPDRLAYEHLTADGWAPGMPALIAVTAVIARQDPVDVFGVVAALLYALTPLVAFAIARLALAWSLRLAVAAAAVVALSPYRLFTQYSGWQPQVAGVACLLAGALAFRAALGGGAHARRLVVLAALLVAGALGTYRLPFLPYITFVTGLVIAGYVVACGRQDSAVVRTLARRSAELAGAVALLAAPSVVAFATHARAFWGGENGSAAWREWVRSLPSDALGLLPRAPQLTHKPPLGLQAVALALALVLLTSGLVALRRSAARERDLVAALTVGSLAAVFLAQLPVFSPYFSIKLSAYGAVPMILTALAPLSGRRLPPRKLVLAAPAVLLSLALVASASRVTLSTATSAALSARAAELPPSKVIRIRSRTSWQQMWAVYYTRDHPVWLAHPSDYLTDFGLFRAPGLAH